MKRLIVMRHATTEPTSPEGDFGRALTPGGHAEAGRVGGWLAEHGHAPDTVLCSSARRVRETWAAVEPGLGASPPVLFDRALYMASAADLLQELSDVEERFGIVMLVAHNPSITHLAFGLAERNDPDGRDRLRAGFRPATLAVFEVVAPTADEGGLGRVRLLEFVHAGDLA